VSQLGGIASFFSKIGDELFLQKMECSISGMYNARSSRHKPIAEPNSHGYAYNYDFTVSASEGFDEIIISHQRIKIQKLPAELNKINLSKTKISTQWGIDIKYERDFKGAVKVEVLEFDSSQFEIPNFYFSAKKQTDKNMKISFIEKQLQRPFYESDSILEFLFSFFDETRDIHLDFSGGDALNIIPSEVKKPEFISRAPQILSDGSGLAATLYHLKKSSLDSRKSRQLRYYQRYVRQELPIHTVTFEKIRDFFLLINTSIIDLDVENIPFNNTLKIKVKILGPKGQIWLPLSALSDGTVKWLSLISAIVTYQSIFAVEEPENFLHPKMQKIITSIIREYYLERTNIAFVLMSTHSETLINAARPSEIIVTSTNAGVTSAKRLRHRALIKQQLNDTGFGLGHFYVAGALDHG
jgi:hypothetical protein